MTENCAVIGTHCMVHGDELLYGHVRSNPFSSVQPHKANIYQHLTHIVVQVPGISTLA